MRLSRSFLLSLLISTPFVLLGLLQWFSGYNWARLGIFPRSLLGAVGILTAPLVHGDWLHLVSNLFSLLILCTATFLFYPRESGSVLTVAYFGTGIGVWLLARPSYHIGVSGQVYALASFLFFSGVFRQNRASLMIALGIGVLYGGMLQGVFPQVGQLNVSWESHLLGALVGGILAWHHRNREAPLLIMPRHNSPVIFDIEEGYQPLRNKQIRYVLVPRAKKL
jgi:membrane associated rhomboid family serine protease